MGEDALALLEGVKELRVARGRKFLRFDLVQARPSDDELLKVMLGRTGKLRAPAVRSGETLLVGFNKDMYMATLGGA